MTLKTGYLDDAGHPHIKIKVWGLSADFGREFEAMIDTGFSGFLMLPLVQALPLALTLFGTTTYTLADGSQSPKLLAHGSIDHEGEITSGLIVLEASPSSGPLVGMDFLKQSSKVLVLGRQGVFLLDEGDLPSNVGEAKPLEEPPTPPVNSD
jgi:predicted aspartyl protease